MPMWFHCSQFAPALIHFFLLLLFWFAINESTISNRVFCHICYSCEKKKMILKKWYDNDTFAHRTMNWSTTKKRQYQNWMYYVFATNELEFNLIEWTIFCYCFSPLTIRLNWELWNFSARFRHFINILIEFLCQLSIGNCTKCTLWPYSRPLLFRLILVHLSLFNARANKYESFSISNPD